MKYFIIPKAMILTGAMTLIGAMILAGCTTGTSSSDGTAEFKPVTFVGAQATSSERTDCEAAGGVIERTGRLGTEQCVQPYPDAGETCSDAADCLGRCLLEVEVERPVVGQAMTGVCQENTNDFGCRTLISGGKLKEQSA